jgi:hypothetical protein
MIKNAIDVTNAGLHPKVGANIPSRYGFIVSTILEAALVMEFLSAGFPGLQIQIQRQIDW